MNKDLLFIYFIPITFLENPVDAKQPTGCIFKLRMHMYKYALTKVMELHALCFQLSSLGS